MTQHSLGSVADAIERLLRLVPERWEDVAFDRLTSTEQEACKLLVGAGLVERRVTLRLEMAGRGDAFEATIAVTGEAGLLEAIEPLLAESWARWSDAIEQWRTATGASNWPFRITKVGQDEWRLSEHGVTARADLDVPLDPHLSPGAAAIVGSRERVIQFVLKSGALRSRPPVAGYGRFVAMNTVPSGKEPGTAPAQATTVNLANAGEVAAAFRDALRPLVEEAVQLKNQPAPVNTSINTKPGTGMPWSEAMAEAERIVKERGDFFPGRNKLAALVGCSPSTLDKAIKRSTYLKRCRAVSERTPAMRETPLTDSIMEEAALAAARKVSDTAPPGDEAEAEPVAFYQAGGDGMNDDEREIAIQRLAAEQDAERVREERQQRLASNRRPSH